MRGPITDPVGEVVSGVDVPFAAERKHLMDVIKMVAYQAETDLVRRITPHYHCAEAEARTLIHSALGNADNITL